MSAVDKAIAARRVGDLEGVGDQLLGFPAPYLHPHALSLVHLVVIHRFLRLQPPQLRLQTANYHLDHHTEDLASKVNRKEEEK